MGVAIVADIGGTNTRVALAEGRSVAQGSIRKYANNTFTGIDAVLSRFVDEARPGAVTGCCVAAAGPLQDGAIEMTNLFDASGAPWIIDRARVSSATGAPKVEILNDLQAQGHALGHIAPEHLRTVLDGPTTPGGPMLVVGLGTGVNAAPVHGTGARRVVPPSECGHISMPVRTDEDLRIVRFVEASLAARNEPPHCGVEEVLAGRGLPMLDAFAAAEAGRPATRSSADVLAGLAAGDEIAERAGRAYTRILANLLADQALIHLPWGGLFLIGGMSRAMAPHLDRFGLASIFREARRIDVLTTSFSVRVVEDDFAALTGCAAWLTALDGRD